MTDHIWTASQPQATMTYEVSEDNPAPVKIEVNNFVQYNYSSGCVKGSWTGDYFEFDVPVRNFKAGTEVTLTCRPTDAAPVVLGCLLPRR